MKLFFVIFIIIKIMNLNGTYISSLIFENYIRDFNFKQLRMVLLISKEWYEVYKKILNEKLYKQLSHFTDEICEDLHIGKILNVLNTNYKQLSKTKMTSLINDEYVIRVSNIDSTFISLFSIFAYYHLISETKEHKKYMKHRVIIFLIIVEYLIKSYSSGVFQDMNEFNGRLIYVKKISNQYKIKLVNFIDKRNIEIINAKLNQVIDMI